MNYILIIGAKSDIGIELAKIYAIKGYNLYLAGRGCEILDGFCKDIKLRTKSIATAKELDITNFDTHEDFYLNLSPRPVGVIVVSGFMSDQESCENDWSKAYNTINVNYTGVVSFLNIVANNMEISKKGFIIGISSVAGDRGRKANYIYGSSKAGLITYLSGLRNRLYASKINVLTVKPGFVYTKMTQGLDLPKLLTARPEEVACDIYYAQQRGKNVLYTKSIWRLIMFIIKLVPEWKFKTMNI